METQGLSDLNKISVEDVRSIWISSLLAESGLPLHKVFLSEEIFLEMEQELLSHLTVDQNGYVEYDDYLDTMLRLVRPIVTTQVRSQPWQLPCSIGWNGLPAMDVSVAY